MRRRIPSEEVACLLQSNIISLILALLMSVFLGPVLPAPKPQGGLGQPPPAAQLHNAMGDKMVLGYFVDDQGANSSLSSLAANSSSITDIGGFWYTFDSIGNVYGSTNQKAVASANAGRIGIYPLVHNVRKSGFDPALAHTVLSVKTSRAKLIRDLTALAWKDGNKGVIIDIENLYPSDRYVYEIFLSELKAAIGPGRNIIAAVPAKMRDDWSSKWSGAFDYRRIGQLVDYVALMTYDEHTAGGAPGPVASYGWTEKVVRYTVERVPPKKVLLGLAGYGYHWQGNSGKSVTFAQAGALARSAGTAVKWSAEYQSPYIQYWDSYGRKNTVWYENSSSLWIKLGLVDRYGLSGVALWRLGQEDPKLWSSISHKWSGKG
jgi:spore germination protein